MLSSTVCRYEHFNTDWYRRAGAMIGVPPGVSAERNASYRKWWEWCAILDVLGNRDMLREGRNGIGFAVGTEPLPSAMATCGAKVLATDLGVDLTTEKWSHTSQHAATLDALYHPDWVSEDRFHENVSFQPADMRDLSGFADASCDFVWSSCAFEHIGSLDDGLDFVVNAMRLIRPGGVAVHTTEYNVSSNDRTVQYGDCIYRRRDIERLDYRLRPLRCGLEAVDFDCGTHEYDLDYDQHPYFEGRARHIKLMMDGFVSTSMVLVIRKGPA